MYIDDLIIYSATPEEPVAHVREVFQLVNQAGLRMKIDKCFFGVDQMQLLGFDFRPDGLSPQEDRIDRITKAEVAHTKKGILSFLGIVRYY